MSTSSEQVMTFGCAGSTLVGILHAPLAGQRRIGVLVVVGGPQYRIGSHRQFVLMARELARDGWPVLRFDYRGMGDSEGVSQTFESVEQDIRAAVDAMYLAQPELEGVVLWGLCDAASASLMYCSGDARLKGMILANPWVRTDAGEARAYLDDYYLQRFFAVAFWRKVLAGGFSPVRSLRELLATLRQARRRSAANEPGFIDRMRRGIEATHYPILVLISEHDLTASAFEGLRESDPRWRVALSPPRVATVRLRDADHTFSTRAALSSATEECKRWLASLS